VRLDRGVLLVGALALDEQLLLEAADVGEVGVGLLLLLPKRFWRASSSPKSTWWASKSGPSTQANAPRRPP
jgi:hypothetical protein